MAADAAVPVLALVGPTGSGKTVLALAAADELGAEIVAVDAFTVYRGMDVGTAKPSVADRARVPHHLVDVLEPEQECAVQWFQQTARTAVEDVRRRGRVPLLVGGSGLYFRAAVDPLEFPPTDASTRAALEARYADDPAAAHAALARADPEAAARIDPENLRRSVRALEVLELTGRRFSEWYRTWQRFESVYPSLQVVGLEVSRAELEGRIVARAAAMLSNGLVEECKELASRDLSRTARQAIGYAEVLDHLAGRRTLDEAVARIVQRTRRYAARQERWFRSDPRVRWQPPGAVVAALAAAARSARA